MKKVSISLLTLLSSILAHAQFNTYNYNWSFFSANRIELNTDSTNVVLEKRTDLKDELSTFEKEWTYENVRIYPIVANEVYKPISLDSTNYISLQTALKQKSIQISEVSTGGTVNSLLLSNVGEDTIMIMAGEVVLGGKQDRAIGQQLLLAPGTKDLKVAVFCVEHGRWNANQTGTKFNGYYGFAGNQIRKKVIVEKNQSGVWNEVSKSHQKAGVSSSTKTFKDIKNSEEYASKLKAYKDYFLPKLMAGNVLGFVIVSGKKILGTEVFATEQLFTQQVDKLLESYITEAIQTGDTVNFNSGDIELHLKGIFNETKQEELILNNGTEIKSKGKKLHMSILGKE